MIDFTYNSIILTDYKSQRERTSLRSLSLLRSPFSSAPIRAAFLSRCTVRPDTHDHVTEWGALAFLQSLCYTDKQEIIPLCGIYFSWKGYHILWM